MKKLLEGRVAIVTGAGRGIGRAHALELARHGAKVVVNDLGVSLRRGHGRSSEPAEEVAALIRAGGGEAVTNGADVADFAAGRGDGAQAIDTFGGLDILVNNAGFVRDRMLVNTSEEEWDAVIRVHLKGHFAPLRHAGAYWRAEAKEGRQRAARVINTSSGAGLQGSVGQATYSAAKAGIAGLTLVAAQEMGRYGVTVNAIAPVARTRMTEGAFPEMMAGVDGGFDAMDPANNSPVVAWLASEEAGDVTGRVIEIEGGKITLENGWRHGPAEDIGASLGRRRGRRRGTRADRRRPRARAGVRRLTLFHQGMQPNLRLPWCTEHGKRGFIVGTVQPGRPTHRAPGPLIPHRRISRQPNNQLVGEGRHRSWRRSIVGAWTPSASWSMNTASSPEPKRARSATATAKSRRPCARVDGFGSGAASTPSRIAGPPSTTSAAIASVPTRS